MHACTLQLFPHSYLSTIVPVGFLVAQPFRSARFLLFPFFPPPPSPSLSLRPLHPPMPLLQFYIPSYAIYPLSTSNLFEMGDGNWY